MYYALYLNPFKPRLMRPTLVSHLTKPEVRYKRLLIFEPFATEKAL
jgi:hypothetical protein